MKYDLIGQLRCPYCTGKFSLVKDLKSCGDRVVFGMVECNCFEFPIVDGVLLLSLTKGYGGSEDILIPYESFLAASITHIKAGDLEGLQVWIEKNAPAIGQLMYQEDLSFIDFDVKYTRDYNTNNAQFLEAQKRQYGVVGESLGDGVPIDEKGESVYPQSFEDMLYRKMGRGGNYYVKRYFDPSVSVTRNFLLNNKPTDYLLSMCFGQGVFENIAREHIPVGKMINLDAQLINIFLVKRFIYPDGVYICHNLYFPLPFSDGFLSAVFTSTCLPELVNQAHVVREIARVTSPQGWAYIEHIWTGKPARFAPGRYYRYMQNQFEFFDQYLELLNNTCDSKRTYLTSYAFDGYKIDAVGAPVPLADVKTINDQNTNLITVVLSPKQVEIGRDIVPLTRHEKQRLRLSPMFDISTDGDIVRGNAKQELKDYMQQTLPDSFEMDLSRIEEQGYVDELYKQGVLLLLPELIAERFSPLNQVQFTKDLDLELA
jgi:SAM-dependent methyltransferase